MLKIRVVILSPPNVFVGDPAFILGCGFPINPFEDDSIGVGL